MNKIYIVTCKESIGVDTTYGVVGGRFFDDENKAKDFLREQGNRRKENLIKEYPIKNATAQYTSYSYIFYGDDFHGDEMIRFAMELVALPRAE